MVFFVTLTTIPSGLRSLLYQSKTDVNQSALWMVEVMLTPNGWESDGTILISIETRPILLFMQLQLI